MVKELYFCGDSRDVQNGKLPTDSKPVTAVGEGVREIRVMHNGQYRVFYLLAKANFVHVLHSFIKKSQKTSKLDIAKGRQRIKEYGL